ncbi:DUF551 domain-containing protein [Cronobacter sakazakii]|uniref:DUF551 domain-containing protein n=1 Tax=Cronobacter sakazakii TaxID=28141 RepID=UPI001F47C4F4|nr:DUF551 domain-containing protein [Cronobacter sakazakii]
MSTISTERLEEITNDKMINQGSEFAKMATELLALRKERERAEPVAWLVCGSKTFKDRTASTREVAEQAVKDRNDGSCIKPLYTAPPAPTDKTKSEMSQQAEQLLRDTTAPAATLSAENDTAAQQFESLAGKAVVPEGWKLVPMRLTAENGAKGALSGEFSETEFVNCPECFGDDECETCDGSGRIEITVPVTWTTIKDIWAKGVEHFATSPQSPGNDHATVSGRWIPCSERMPPENTGVLVTTEFDGPGDWRMKWGTRVPGHPDAKSGWFIPGASWTPSHWQPLPEPPCK